MEYRDLYRRRDGRWWIEETESRITSFLTEDIAEDGFARYLAWERRLLQQTEPHHIHIKGAMDQARPYGATRDAQLGFSKVFVHDLDAMDVFYREVFGVVELFRHQDRMLGRDVSEIGYQPTYQGGPSLTLIKYQDSTGPMSGESVQGFTTTDIEALVARAEAAGGSIPDPIRRIDKFGITVVFVIDPEGHVNEVVQLDA